MGQDSNFFLAMQLGIMDSIGAGIPFFENYVKNIRRVSDKDILRVAQNYLTSIHRTVGILIPKKDRTFKQ